MKLFWLLACLPALAKAQRVPSDFPFHTPQVRVVGATVRVRVRARPGLVPSMQSVPMTTEPWSMVIPKGTGALREADLLGSGLVLDLDGDGRSTGVLPFSCERDGSVTIEAGGDMTNLFPLGWNPAIYRLLTGESRIGRLGERGVYIFLFGPCSKGRPGSIGFGPGRVRVEALPGPLLQVLVLEGQPGASASSALGLADLALDGKPLQATIREGRTWEPIFGAEPSWAAVRWFTVQLHAPWRHEISFRLTGRSGAKGVVSAVVQQSPGPERRVWGGYATAPLR